MARRTRTPPPVVMSGRVLEYAVLPKSIKYSGAALHFVGEKELGLVPCLAIEQELRTGAIGLVYCDRDWNVLTAAEYETVRDAKRRAERMYPGSSSYWRPRRVTESQAKEYLAHWWDGFECSFCRRSPEEAHPIFENGLARICGPCVEKFHATLGEAPSG